LVVAQKRIMKTPYDFPSNASRRAGDVSARRVERREVMATDDHELVERYRAGEYEAGRQLLHNHWRQLIRLALPKMGGNLHDAEDAVGDALLALAQPRDDRPVDSVGAWLGQAVHNKAVDKVRRKEPVPTSELEVSPAGSDGGIGQVDEQLAAHQLMQALDERERLAMAAAIKGKYEGRLASWQAQQVGMGTHELYAVHRRARKQAKDARLLLHMINEPRPCQGVVEACGGAAGQAVPKLTPERRQAGMAHIKGCNACRVEQERLKNRVSLPVVMLIPSPELYDRIRSVCDARRLETEADNAGGQRRPRNAEAFHTGGKRNSARRDGAGGAARRRPRRRRTGRAVAASLAAVIAAAVVADNSGASISWPEIRSLPGVREITSGGAWEGPSSGDSTAAGGTTGGDDGVTSGGIDGGGGGNGDENTTDGSDGGTGNENTTDGSDGGTGNENTTDGSDGGTGNENTTDGSDGGTGQGDVLDGSQDVTGPSVSLAGTSTEAVGQEVVDHHGYLMQTCGPAGTPTTYSVWVTVSDPSGIESVQLTARHPTDAPFTTDRWAADGDSLRFDVPAYRSGPRHWESRQLQLSVTATDSLGNSTDTVLRSLTLYECGESG
jgi:DNA-directed RNA polymerase specialized sigma24 family protein